MKQKFPFQVICHLFTYPSADIDHFNYGILMGEHISFQVQEGARPVHLHGQRRLRQIRFDFATTREHGSASEVQRFNATKYYYLQVYVVMTHECHLEDAC